MEKEITYRHNVMNINSLDTFLSIKGGFNGSRRDVYFVRALGCGPDTEAGILAADKRMGLMMRGERAFYTRLKLPSPLISQEDMLFYSSQFEALKADQKIYVRNQDHDERFGCALNAACTEAIEKYRLTRKNMTESIEKNFIIKLLYWTDCVPGRSLADWNERKCFKILVENVQKEQEYLFCYMLTLLGCDVLLLECQKDILTTDALKNLSAEFRLGEFNLTWQPPKYQLCEGNEETGISFGGRADKEGITTSAGNKECGTENAGYIRTPVRVSIPEKPGRRHSGARVQPPSQSQKPPQMQTQPGQQAQVQSHPHSRPQQETWAQAQAQACQQSAVQPQPGTLPQSPSQKPPQSRRQSVVSGNLTGNQEKSFEELALLASSIVMIAVYNRAGEPIATGSGIMIGRDGYILTNNHVTRGGCFFAVRIEDDENIYKTNEIIKYNTVLDLAVIRIDRRLAPLPLYKGRKLARGQKVVAIGSPLGMFNSVSDGIISGFREIDSVDMIQFTAPISHGSSGGAVLNMQGEIIGISTAGIDEGQNINLAVSYEDIGMFVRGFTG